MRLHEREWDQEIREINGEASLYRKVKHVRSFLEEINTLSVGKRKVLLLDFMRFAKR